MSLCSRAAVAAAVAVASAQDEATPGSPRGTVDQHCDITTSKLPACLLLLLLPLLHQVTFSPDGRWVLSASFDKSIKLWDGLKGTFVATFRNHVGPVFQVRHRYLVIL
jgi:ribosome assembly protein 4